MIAPAVVRMRVVVIRENNYSAAHELLRDSSGTINIGIDDSGSDLRTRCIARNYA
jgi:hypothetical protein